MLRRPSFGELLELAMSQPRTYGAGDPFVVGRLFALLREVAWSVHLPEQRECVREQLTRLRSTTAGPDVDEAERGRLVALGDQVEQALEGRWATGGGP